MPVNTGAERRGSDRVCPWASGGRLRRLTLWDRRRDGPDVIVFEDGASTCTWSPAGSRSGRGEGVAACPASARPGRAREVPAPTSWRRAIAPAAQTLPQGPHRSERLRRWSIAGERHAAGAFLGAAVVAGAGGRDRDGARVPDAVAALIRAAVVADERGGTGVHEPAGALVQARRRGAPGRVSQPPARASPRLCRRVRSRGGETARAS